MSDVRVYLTSCYIAGAAFYVFNFEFIRITQKNLESKVNKYFCLNRSSFPSVRPLLVTTDLSNGFENIQHLDMNDPEHSSGNTRIQTPEPPASVSNVSPPTDEVATVSLKLPPFWTHKPNTWFNQIEAQFALKNISNDQTKYFYIVAALDADTADRIEDTIDNPPSCNKYDTIKEKLLQAFTLSSYAVSYTHLTLPTTPYV